MILEFIAGLALNIAPIQGTEYIKSCIESNLNRSVELNYIGFLMCSKETKLIVEEGLTTVLNTENYECSYNKESIKNAYKLNRKIEDLIYCVKY